MTEATAPEAPEAPEAAALGEVAPLAKIVLAVGESTPVDQAHLDLIIAAERHLHQQLLNLGSHSEKVHQEGLQIQAMVQRARKQFEETVKGAGIATGLNFHGDFSYNYSQDSRSFTRTK